MDNDILLKFLWLWLVLPPETLQPLAPVSPGSSVVITGWSQRTNEANLLLKPLI